MTGRPDMGSSMHSVFGHFVRCTNLRKAADVVVARICYLLRMLPAAWLLRQFGKYRSTTVK